MYKMFKTNKKDIRDKKQPFLTVVKLQEEKKEEKLEKKPTSNKTPSKLKE